MALEEELRVVVALFWGFAVLEEELRVVVALFCLLLEEELRVVVALFFCCELEEEEEDGLVTVALFDFDDEEDDLVAVALFEDEDELLDAELELFEDEDVLRVAVALEPPPLRVCAAAGTEQTSAPARRAASVSLNSFIIFDFAVPR